MPPVVRPTIASACLGLSGCRDRCVRRELLGHEVDRLVALQKVNPGVRDAEIEFFKEQLGHFEKALEHARLRLDAIRVIVAI